MGGGGGVGRWRHTGEILRVSLVMAKPVLAVGYTVQVPGSGQQGLVPCWRNICHLTLVLLLVSFPNVDNCVFFQLQGTRRYIRAHTHTRHHRCRDWGQTGNRRQEMKSLEAPLWKTVEITCTFLRFHVLVNVYGDTVTDTKEVRPQEQNKTNRTEIYLLLFSSFKLKFCDESQNGKK